MKRDQWVRLVRIVGAITVALWVLLIALILWSDATEVHAEHHERRFLQQPVDRPVIESMPRVWEARATGISRFYFDGEYYVVDNLPKEYVDYSAWYVRLP